MIYAKEKPQTAVRILGKELWESIREETGIKGGLGHQYYEEIRNLDKTKDAKKYLELEKKSMEYYSLFR